MSGRPAPPPLDLRAYGAADLESVRVLLYAKLGYRTVREGDMACRHLAAFASTSRVPSP